MDGAFLATADLRRTPTLLAGVLVVGSGVAGLRAALAAAEAGSEVMLLAKGGLPDSSTFEAQGGIAVALSAGDSVDLHVGDTLAAGAGLCREDAVRAILAEAPPAVEELAAWGARFDRDNGGFAFGREAAHTVSRILHAAGDQTGREVANTLISRVRAHPRITVLERLFVIDLLHHEGAVWGVLAMDSLHDLLVVMARAVVLATGGASQVYRESTNPEVATGDGLGMAARAGATLEDMEFVQFHPTTLYLAGVKRLLITEAVRGEGALLLNTRRERFMPDYHPAAELAPRDVVSRAILEEMRRTESPHVYLDLRHLGAQRVASRFPFIAGVCATYGLDVTRNPVPVRPAAHYFMGGIKTDLHGRTGIARLYAAGECACTGLHGANRLASNSLLEGLVMGRRAGAAAAEETEQTRPPLKYIESRYRDEGIEINVEDMHDSLKALMWRQVGIVRDGEALASTGRALRYWCHYVFRKRFRNRRGLELQNMLHVATFMARAAHVRTESRGAHYRSDFTETLPEWRRHIPLVLADLED